MIDSNNYLTFKALKDGSTIKLLKVGNPNLIHLRYSYNQGLDWTYVIWEDDMFTQTFQMLKDSFISFDNNFEFQSDIMNYYNFEMTGQFEVFGKLSSLYGFSNSIGQNKFGRLFKNCTSLQTAPALPATELSPYCYDSMFYNLIHYNH